MSSSEPILTLPILNRIRLRSVLKCRCGASSYGIIISARFRGEHDFPPVESLILRTLRFCSLLALRQPCTLFVHPLAFIRQISSRLLPFPTQHFALVKKANIRNLEYKTKMAETLQIRQFSHVAPAFRPHHHQPKPPKLPPKEKIELYIYRNSSFITFHTLNPLNPQQHDFAAGLHTPTISPQSHSKSPT